MNKKQDNKSTVEDLAPKDLVEYKKMKEAGLSLEFDKQAHRESSLPQMATGLRFVPYQYSRMEEYFPSALIDKAPSSYNIERELNPSLGNVSFKRVDGSTTPTLNEFINEPGNRLQAILMIHKGKVIFESYPGMPKEDRHLWNSASKSTPGILNAILATEGKIDITKPVSYYIPEWKNTPWDDVSVHDNMNMTTGLNVQEEFSQDIGKPDHLADHFVASLYRYGDYTPWVELCKGVKKLYAPGTVHRYSNISAQSMCKVVENALGKPFRTILEERLFHSSGNTDTISVMLMDDGIAQGVGGISTTLEDFARYAFSYTPSFKRLTGRDGIPQAAIDFIFKNQIDPEVFAKGNLYAMGQANYGADHPVSAGSLFDFFFEDGAFSKHGHHSQGIYLDPKRDFAGVYFSTQPTGSAENLAAGYMRAISKTL